MFCRKMFRLNKRIYFNLRFLEKLFDFKSFVIKVNLKWVKILAIKLALYINCNCTNDKYVKYRYLSYDQYA